MDSSKNRVINCSSETISASVDALPLLCLVGRELNHAPYQYPALPLLCLQPLYQPEASFVLLFHHMQQ